MFAFSPSKKNKNMLQKGILVPFAVKHRLGVFGNDGKIGFIVGVNIDVEGD